MINRHYLVSELTRRGRRTAVNIGLVALVTGILVVITLLANGLNQAFQAPLREIGANITVQMGGDVPEQMGGPVLPCSVAPISENQYKSIAALPAVQAVGRAVLFWDFSEENFQIVVGFQPGDRLGPALAQGTLVQGRRLRPNERHQALADITWAEKNGSALGSQVLIGGRSFTLVGLVDTSALSGIGTANLYIPLAEAQDIVASAPGVQAVHRFTPRDSNLLFIRAQRDRTGEVASRIRQLLGDKASVSTPDSFRQLLGSLFALTRQFGVMISAVVLVLAALLMGRNSAAAIRERAMEIGIMKAVGWTGRDIQWQLLAEQALFIILGTILGCILGWLLSQGLSLVTIDIPIPWDMAPTPHFLPGGDTQLVHQVRLTMDAGGGLLLLVGLVPLVLGPASAWGAIRLVTRLHTSEVLRYE